MLCLCFIVQSSGVLRHAPQFTTGSHPQCDKSLELSSNILSKTPLALNLYFLDAMLKVNVKHEHTNK